MKTKFARAIGWILLTASFAAQQQTSEFRRAADAMERVTWRTRTLVANDRLTNWDLAISVPGLTFLETVVRADAALVPFVEAANVQKVGPQNSKNLDFNLPRDEVAAVRNAMGENVRVSAYRVDSLPADAQVRRRVFEFTRALGATTLVVPAATALAGLDSLAEEFLINVAVMSPAPDALKIMEGRSRRLGIGIDTAVWAQEGVSPRERLGRVKDRLLYVNLRDRSARAGNARNVMPGKGVANLSEFFNEMQRLNVRGIALTIDTSGIVEAPGDLFSVVAAVEAVVQPAYAAQFLEFAKTRPIRFDLVTPSRDETLTPAEIERRAADTRQKIDAAIPQRPYAQPKEPRTLLVIESLEGMSHNTIPLTNVMIQRMGEKTGAWTTVFSNDLTNLRYPKITEFDAVFLNSIVGEFLPDASLRADLVRYVREGGGIGGIHGTPWASRNWDEFAEMIGAQSAPHRIENGILHVYDKNNPLVAPFNYEDLPFREEYYRFEHTGNGRLRWDSVRVLLTVALDDPKVEPRPWDGYKRPDNVYPVAWIRKYGNGRVFYNSMGHMTETFMRPEIVGHFLAGLQFMLGDLDADATPNPLK